MKFKSILAVTATTALAFSLQVSAAAAQSKLVGRSIDMFAYHKTTHCFRVGGCVEGGWDPTFLKVYIGNSGKLYSYMSNSDRDGQVYTLGTRDDDGILFDLDHNTVTLDYSDAKSVLTYQYTVSGDTCRVNLISYFRDGSGALDDLKWRQFECHVYEGNHFAK